MAGKDPEAQKFVKILAVSLGSIKQYYDEKYDRGNFIKNVILDNILPGDIYLKSHELHFDSEVSRVCMLVKIAEKNDISAYDVLQNLFPDKNKDFIININETDIALVKEIKPNIDEKDIDKLASSIVDTLSSEFYTHCTVGHRHGGQQHQGPGPLLQGGPGGPGGGQRSSTPRSPSSATTTWASPG